MIGYSENQVFIVKLQQFITHVADFLADIPESAGNGIQNAINKLTAPPGHPHTLFVFVTVCVIKWLANIIAGVTNLAGSLIKAVIDVFGGVLTAGVKMLQVILNLDRRLLREACGDLLFPLAGAVLLSGGHLISLVQRVICCQRFDRELGAAEQRIIQAVFEDSLGRYNIRIVEGWSGLFGLGTHRAFTLGNLIFTNKMDFIREPAILVHECVHVWQSQHLGCRYAAEALFYQWTYRHEVRSGAYDWTAESSRGREQWLAFNPEAAAELVEDIWREGFFDEEKARTGLFVSGRDGKDFTCLARETVVALQSQKTRRLSVLLHPEQAG